MCSVGEPRGLTVVILSFVLFLIFDFFFLGLCAVTFGFFSVYLAAATWSKRNDWLWSFFVRDFGDVEMTRCWAVAIEVGSICEWHLRSKKPQQTTSHRGNFCNFWFGLFCYCLLTPELYVFVPRLFNRSIEFIIGKFDDCLLSFFVCFFFSFVLILKNSHKFDLVAFAFVVVL